MFVFETFPPLDLDLVTAGKPETTQVRVLNLKKGLPSPTSATRKSLVTAAGRLWPDMPEDDRWTIARACADPKTAAAVAKAGIRNRVAGEAEIGLLPVDVLLPMIVPLVQPRIADSPTHLPPPDQVGVVDLHGNILPAVNVIFKNEQHLIDHVAEVIRGTMRNGRELRTSILAQGVTHPILALVATITLEDPGDEFTVLAAADGITRLTMSWAAALGGDVADGDLPEAIVERLFHQAKTGSLSGAHRKGQDKVYADMCRAFQSAAGDTTDPVMARIGQTVVLPANIVVSYRRIGDEFLEDQLRQAFPDAIASAVGQQHGLSREWPDSAIGANAGIQAARRSGMSGELDDAVVRIAAGLDVFTEKVIDVVAPDPVEGAEESVGDTSTGGEVHLESDPELARGVYLASELCQQAVFKDMKKHLRAIRGHGKILPKKYAEYISGLITRGWSPWKQESVTNERRAWASGGAIPHRLYGTDWTPLFMPYYRDLVPIAIDDTDRRQESARATIEVAGGMALMAEGLLLTAAGSTAQSRKVEGVTFHRSQPQVIVETLGTSEKGLWLLAHAADSFQSHNQAVSAYGVTKTIPNDAYRLKFPDPADNSKSVEFVEDPKSGRKVLDFDMVRIVAGLQRSESPGGGNNGSGGGKSTTAKMNQLRGRISDHISGLEADLQVASALSAANPGLPVFATTYDWEAARNSLFAVSGDVGALKPLGDPVDVQADDESFFNDVEGEDEADDELMVQ